MPGYPHQHRTYGSHSSSDVSPTVQPRGTRLSLTFRKVRRMPCTCGKFLGHEPTDNMLLLLLFLPCRISLAMWFTTISCSELSSCNKPFSYSELSSCNKLFSYSEVVHDVNPAWQLKLSGQPTAGRQLQWTVQLQWFSEFPASCNELSSCSDLVSCLSAACSELSTIP